MFIPYIKRLIRDPVQIGRCKIFETRWPRWALSLPYYVPNSWRDKHFHCLGLTGSAKSTLLNNMFEQDVLAGRGCTMIDPDADLSSDMLRRLIADGYFGKYLGTDGDGHARFEWNEANCQRTIYFEPARRSNYVVPFNVLNNATYRPDTLANHISDGFKRAWPSVKDGPRFTSVLYPALILLIQAGLTLPDLYLLLEDPGFRTQVLLKSQDRHHVKIFLEEFKLWHQIQADNNESVTNKLTHHIFNEDVRRCMGVMPNAINPSTIMDEGRVLIVNLRDVSREIERLLGGMITVLFEQAALSRPESGGRRQHYYYMDEFQNYADPTSLNETLSRGRKRNFRMGLFHQTLSQLPGDVSTTLANVGLFLPFVNSPDDARVMVHHLKTRSKDWANDISELQELPRYHFYIHTRDPRRLNVLVTEPPRRLNVTDAQKEAVIQHLEALHGVPAPKFGQKKASVDFFEMPLPKKVWAMTGDGG